MGGGYTREGREKEEEREATVRTEMGDSSERDKRKRGRQIRGRVGDKRDRRRKEGRQDRG
jgi:hypothetical protein